MGQASTGRNSLGRNIKNTPLIKKIDLSSAQGFSPRRRSPPIGGERLRGEFPRAVIPVPHIPTPPHLLLNIVREKQGQGITDSTNNYNKKKNKIKDNLLRRRRSLQTNMASLRSWQGHLRQN